MDGLSLDSIENTIDGMQYRDGAYLGAGFRDSLMMLMRRIPRLPDAIDTTYGQIDMTWLRDDGVVLLIDFQEGQNIEIKLIDESIMEYCPPMERDPQEYAQRMFDSDIDIRFLGISNAFNASAYTDIINGFDGGGRKINYDDSHEKLTSLMTIQPGTPEYDDLMKSIENVDGRQRERENMRRTFDEIVADDDSDGR